ncbi:outer membrane protein assembly factor BamD [Maridesulfovibrio hydrothermalis]|uniref:Outer membrane assembly lipoprotein YfiO n=1 Tax=Maridesulfovibrio hydrothermalis AM13 = DSM 14728 TaxID=1121451 RepID=L0RFS0_9BACT|nr:outer membrane protein assembly factor BamD [Maridesulfovibrio hydrothermalis]CCO24396.1 Outer membrane assembly lipoprotein YfiO [Maridesulfovibrio hydrothermalis AM13 = DSM 14728]
MRIRILSIVLFYFLFISISGCGVIDYYFLPKPEDTAQELYEAGVESMKEKDYSDASEFFSKLKDRYPFSPYTVKAEVSLGDALFLDGKYFDASEAYKEFAALHPGNEEIPYVLYQIGLSNFSLFGSIDRPQTNISEALEYFYRVEEAYPDSEYAKASKEYIVKCRRSLADHELYIADFFWRSAKFGSAWKRYAFVVRNFKDLPAVRKYAMKQAEMSYYEYQKTLSQEEREKLQGSWKELVDWL